MKIFLLSFYIIIFSFPVYAKSSYEEIVIDSLNRISKKIDNVDDKLDKISQRVSSLESWREEQNVNIERFYSKDWAHSLNNYKAVTTEVKDMQEQLSKMTGAFVAFMIFGSLMSFVINLVITLIVSKKKAPILTIDDRSQIIKLRSDKV